VREGNAHRLQTTAELDGADHGRPAVVGCDPDHDRRPMAEHCLEDEVMCASPEAPHADGFAGGRRDGELCGQHVIRWVCAHARRALITINGVLDRSRAEPALTSLLAHNSALCFRGEGLSSHP
jgi:hypothetical protein